VRIGNETVTLLLDTHVWLWAVEAPEKLGRRAQSLLLTVENDRLVSAISVLEIARLCLDEKVILSISPKKWIEDSARDLHLQQVEVDFAIALEAYSLPDPFHRDPVDRVLVATARTLQATLLTADERILAYKHARTEDCRN
jgi:PIN domain nuclease of toxin-antitoxin system